MLGRFSGPELSAGSGLLPCKHVLAKMCNRPLLYTRLGHCCNHTTSLWCPDSCLHHESKPKPSNSNNCEKQFPRHLSTTHKENLRSIRAFWLQSFKQRLGQGGMEETRVHPRRYMPGRCFAQRCISEGESKENTSQATPCSRGDSRHRHSCHLTFRKLRILCVRRVQMPLHHSRA